MFKHILPRDDNFFKLFNSHSDEMVTIARQLHELFTTLTDVENRVKKIKEHEKKADAITHETTNLLHSTFITPFDRDQIYQLITKMDDIADVIEDVAQTIFLYDVKTLTPEAMELESIIGESVLRIQKLVSFLADMKHAKEILAIAKEIKELEEKADNVMRLGVSKLFRNGADLIQIIKMKEVYELLETVTDLCDDCADIAKGVVLENA